MEMATKHLAAMPLQQISQQSPTTQIQNLESSRHVCLTVTERDK